MDEGARLASEQKHFRPACELPLRRLCSTRVSAIGYSLCSLVPRSISTPALAALQRDPAAPRASSKGTPHLSCNTAEIPACKVSIVDCNCR